MPGARRDRRDATQMLGQGACSPTAQAATGTSLRVSVPSPSSPPCSPPSFSPQAITEPSFNRAKLEAFTASNGRRFGDAADRDRNRDITPRGAVAELPFSGLPPRP